ncbi:hypothetical protein QTO34_001119 [Cnephaeus nilssonii]|uniref:R-spondin-3 n=1 Tax=Cnephaeus nilssonii TaxID=3371016 RepID=A0AA40HV93_CNENI|nr:hypothetical protein QTO34_001119 [Eptesicus nilssonii]
MQIHYHSTITFSVYCGDAAGSRSTRPGRVHPNVSQGCQGGCATCSDYNGCLSCKPRLFFVLERIGMKQIGVCLSSCPSGYYGTRYPDINKCTKCKADCDTCFNKNFCTKCKSGFYLHLGKCLGNCPEGLEANNHTMECVSIVHCEASEWSAWSPCTKKGKTCGFKRGTETRVREITQHPSAKGNLCPPTSETRKCTVQRKKCQKGERGTKRYASKNKKLFVSCLATLGTVPFLKIQPSTSATREANCEDKNYPHRCLQDEKIGSEKVVFRYGP